MISSYKDFLVDMGIAVYYRDGILICPNKLYAFGGNMKHFSEVYRNLSAEDKEALKQLKDEESARTGKDVTLREVLEAVTPQESERA